MSAALTLQHFGYRVCVFEQTRELREIGAGVVITPNAMHALNFLGVGERISKEAGPTEAYLIRHFQTGEVIKIRANGTDYVERFGATYHQVDRADLHATLAEAIPIACSSTIASRLSRSILIMLWRRSQIGKHMQVMS